MSFKELRENYTLQDLIERFGDEITLKEVIKKLKKEKEGGLNE